LSFRQLERHFGKWIEEKKVRVLLKVAASFVTSGGAFAEPKPLARALKRSDV